MWREENRFSAKRRNVPRPPNILLLIPPDTDHVGEMIACLSVPIAVQLGCPSLGQMQLVAYVEHGGKLFVPVFVPIHLPGILPVDEEQVCINLPPRERFQVGGTQPYTC